MGLSLRRIDETDQGIWHWLFLRLSVTCLVITAGVALLWVAADHLPTQSLRRVLAAEYVSVAVGAVSVFLGAPRRYVQAFQLTVDIFVIAACVHLTGGLDSRFQLLYFFPLVVAAYELRQKGALYAAALSSAAILSYTLLVAAERLTPVDVVFREGVVSNGSLIGAHVTVSLLLVVGYVAGEMAGRLDRKARLLLHRSDELEHSRLETQSILDHMGSGVMTLDHEGVVRRMNPAASRILGIDVVALEGRRIADGLGSIMPIMVGHLMECAVEGTSADRVELHIERQDASVVPIGLSVNPMRDVEGERCGVVAVFQDLSTVFRMRERVRSNDRLAAMGELSASIAHEIRNPLASIRGSVEMLQGELKLDGENARLFELIHRESARLNRIIEDFLEYARMRPPAPRNCRLNDVISDLEDLLRNHDRIQGRDRLKVLAEDADVIVHIDEELMRQVFLNLALNGFESMGDEGELRVSVAVRPHHLPPEVVIRFIDEGHGIDEENVQKIFEPFFTTKSNGTGLGLPMAHRIVSNHDGQLRVRNVDGGGAEFSVHLPLVGVYREGRLITGNEALEVLGGREPATAAGAAVEGA